MIGRLSGHPVRCVMPESVSVERRDLLTFFGAEVILSPASRAATARCGMAKQLYEEDPSVFMPMQYENAANPNAHYETTGPEILRDCPEITHFVAGLGTGGTLTGVGRYLKEQRPNTKIVAAAPHPGDLVQGLRSLDEGYIPPVLDESVLDGRIVIDSRTSFAVTKSPPSKKRASSPASPAARRCARRSGSQSARSAGMSWCSWPTAAGNTSPPDSGRATTTTSPATKQSRAKSGGNRRRNSAEHSAQGSAKGRDRWLNTQTPTSW